MIPVKITIESEDSAIQDSVASIIALLLIKSGFAIDASNLDTLDNLFQEEKKSKHHNAIKRVADATEVTLRKSKDCDYLKNPNDFKVDVSGMSYLGSVSLAAMISEHLIAKGIDVRTGTGASLDEVVALNQREPDDAKKYANIIDYWNVNGTKVRINTT